MGTVLAWGCARWGTGEIHTYRQRRERGEREIQREIQRYREGEGKDLSR
jgi:hypothetical protein